MGDPGTIEQLATGRRLDSFGDDDRAGRDNTQPRQPGASTGQHGSIELDHIPLDVGPSGSSGGGVGELHPLRVEVVEPEMDARRSDLSECLGQLGARDGRLREPRSAIGVEFDVMQLHREGPVRIRCCSRQM